MKTRLYLAGALFIFASVTFWLSWYLMPDPGATEAAHILTLVKLSRKAVLWSVAIQVLSAVSYLFALFFTLQGIGSSHKLRLPGIALAGVGAMGLCSDAFFHLLAWCMTSKQVHIQSDVVQVMHLMQTRGLLFLVPLFLLFFIGSLVLAVSLHRSGLVSKKPYRLFSLVLLAGSAATVLAGKIGVQGPWPALLTLGLFATALGRMGYELIRSAGKACSQQKWTVA